MSKNQLIIVSNNRDWQSYENKRRHNRKLTTTTTTTTTTTKTTNNDNNDNNNARTTTLVPSINDCSRTYLLLRGNFAYNNIVAVSCDCKVKNHYSFTSRCWCFPFTFYLGFMVLILCVILAECMLPQGSRGGVMQKETP